MSRQGKPRNRTYDNIKNFWQSEAAEWGDSPQVTIRDHFFRIHELQNLLSLIPQCGRLLDLGCGTGFGTLVLAKKARQAVGIDYSSNMIQFAKKLRDDDGYRSKIMRDLCPLWPIYDHSDSQVSFLVRDLLDLKLEFKQFDVITGQRILINLPEFSDQMRALENIRIYAKDNTLLILTEPTVQGYARTDAYRLSFGLPELEKYWHNKYVDESSYNQWQNFGWRVVTTLSFDTYMLFSKVIYPAACGPSKCEFLSGANRAAMEIANLFRTQKAAEEIGQYQLLKLFYERVSLYNQEEARQIKSWIEQNQSSLPDWRHLGHQKSIIACVA
jgi:SAM-dependent methyltransferase